jgi:hypothetical protein
MGMQAHEVSRGDRISIVDIDFGSLSESKQVIWIDQPLPRSSQTTRRETLLNEEDPLAVGRPVRAESRSRTAG